MESAESLTKYLEKEKIADETDALGSFSAYVPTKLDYTDLPREIEEALTEPFSISDNNHILISDLSQSSASLSLELQGATSIYEILPRITLETAKALQAQIGLMIPIEPGKESTIFISNRGHFGQLRLGRDKKSGRYYGIKEITEASKVKESLEEAKLQRQLNGLPHLMPLVDAVELEDSKGNKRLYHIMPLAALGNGRELADYLVQIKDVSFKEALLVHIAKCVLKGFAGMHSQGIAHLDFKPENLVIDVNGNVFVIDFGCAKELDQEGYVKGRNLGDVNYYSPERQASSTNFSGKTNDCYTIGLTLLELAVGKIVKKDTLPEHYLKQPFLQNALPGSYAALIKGLLEIEPTKRLTIEKALSWKLFSKETSPQILAYLREFVQSLQWENRVKEYKGIQKGLTSAQQLPLPHFTGYVHRSIENKVIEKLLSGSTAPIACVGIGGIGKTQLLTYVVHTPQIQSHFSHIFWFRAADNETSLNIQYYGLAQELKLIDEEALFEEAKRVLIQWFEHQSHSWLIVFDNADSPETLNSFLPKKGGNILLSSRSPQWQEAISIDVMRVSEIQEMLSKLIPEKSVFSDEAKELGERLGYLPLALSQAIAMIRQENLSIKDYVERFTQKQKELLNANTSLFGKHLPHSMVTLYQLQLQRLENECPEAIQLLHYSALCAPDAIPVKLLNRGVLGKEVPLDTYQNAQECLIRYALWQLKEEGIYIHRLMQEVIKVPLSQETTNELFLVLAKRCNEEFTQETEVLEKEQRQKALFYHLKALKRLGEKEEALRKTLAFATILHSIGVYYAYQARQPQIAKSLFGITLTINEKHYGTDHPETGRTLTNLGNVYGALGGYEKQRDLVLRALSIDEKHYGTDHPHTGITLNSLGNAYGDLGEHEKQRDYLLRALSITEKHYGTDHPETGITLGNVGNAYGDLGEHEKQRDYLLRALSIIEKHYGTDHPQTGMTLGNLGNAYGTLGEYEKQRDCLLKVLSIIEKHYGTDHPETGRTLMNLGNAYGYLGEYEKQRDYLLRALSITEKHYGTDHPQTGMTLSSLGIAYASLNDNEKAYTYQKRSYDILVDFYGPNNQYTQYSAKQLQKLGTSTQQPIIFSNTTRTSSNDKSLQTSSPLKQSKSKCTIS